MGSHWGATQPEIFDYADWTVSYKSAQEPWYIDSMLFQPFRAWIYNCHLIHYKPRIAAAILDL